MGWARLDDGWHDHPKVSEAGLEAAGLWAMCLTWAYRNRRTSPTPGVVPDSVVARFAGGKARRLTARLLELRLLDAHIPAGWPIHDFEDYLPNYSPEQAKAAGAKGGQAKASKQTAKRIASEPLDETLPDQERTATDSASGLVANSSRLRAGTPSPNPPSLRSGSAPSERGASAPAHASTRERDDAREALHAGAVVAAWVEACEANDVRPSAGQRSQVGRLAKELLAAGNDPARVLAAARAAAAKGFATIDRELTAMAGRRPGALEAPDDELPAYWRPENDVSAMIARGE